MTTALQLLVSGITVGSVYVLLALGWVLVYRVSGLIYLIVGEFAVLSVLTCSALLQHRLGTPLAIVVGILVAPVVSGVVDLGLRRLPRLGHLQSVLLMIGLSFLLEELFRRVFGPDSRLIPPFLPTQPIKLGGVAILPHQVLLVGATAVLALGMWLLLQRTLFGRAMNACSESETGARVCGISPWTMRSVSLAIAALTAAVGGILLGPIQPFSPTSGIQLSTLGFIAAALGLWTFPGAAAAGVLLGCISSFGAGYVSSAYQDIFALGALLVALVAATLPGSPAVIRKRLDAV